MANRLAGRLRRVDPTGFNKVSALGIGEQRVNVIVGVTDSPERWQSLGHGYRVEAHIVVCQCDDVLVVLISALFRHGEALKGFLPWDGKARPCEVDVGHRNGQASEVLEAPQERNQVVL